MAGSIGDTGNLEPIQKSWDTSKYSTLLGRGTVNLDPDGRWIECKLDKTKINCRHPFKIGRLLEHNRYV